MKEEQKIQTKNTAGFMDSNVKHLYDAMISQGYTGLGDFSNFEGNSAKGKETRIVEFSTYIGNSMILSHP